MPPHAERERRVFASLVRAMRRARDLTQEEVARNGGFGHKYPGQVERGEVEPKLRSMVGLAQGLGMQVGDFFREYAELLDAAEEAG